MPKTDQTYQYIDPRRLEGSPFEVAAAAFEQAANVGDLLETALDDAYVFARNAEMERQIMAGNEPDGLGFDTTVLGKRLAALRHVIAQTLNSMDAVAKAAVFDPKNPPKED